MKEKTTSADSALVFGEIVSEKEATRTLEGNYHSVCDNLIERLGIGLTRTSEGFR